METANNSEPQPTMQESLTNLAESYVHHLAGEAVDPRQVAQNLTILYQDLGKRHKKDPNLAVLFQKCGPLARDPDTGQNLIHDQKMLDLIYPHRHRKPKHPLRKRLALTAAALGTAAIGTAGVLLIKEMADLKAQGGPPPILYDSGKLFTGDKPPESVKPQENLFNEFIKPFVEEARVRRQNWADTDPEYSHIIDRELNENRLNIVVFGYGEEHGESYEDYGGAPSILSLDLRTNKIAVVHFSRDIRAPELERLLPEDQRQPTSIRGVFRIGGKNEGGFKQMRYLIGSMSGLVADYQMVMKDLVLRDVIARLADGNLEIDVPKDHDTGPFRLDRIQYGNGFIRQGKQVMDTASLMRYILAEDKNPEGKKDERSYRKNQATEAIVERIRNKLKGKSMLEKIIFLNQIKDLIDEEVKNKNLELEFSPDLISRSFGGIFNIASKLLGNFGQNIELTVPEIDKTREIVFHDPSFGDGAVTRVHNIFSHPNDGRTDNPRVLEEVKALQLPGWMLIPDGGNPYSDDLVRDYWHSTRTMVKQILTGTPH